MDASDYQKQSTWKKRASAISEARRIETILRQIAENLADDSFLNGVPYKQIEPLESDTHHAHKVITNLLRDMGDDVPYLGLPLRSKEKEHQYKFEFDQ